MSNNQATKFFLEDISQIQLSFSFANPTPSLTPYVRLSLQQFPRDPYAFHDQVPLSDDSQPSQKMFIDYPATAFTKLKFEVVIPFTGSKQILGQSTVSYSDLLNSRSQSLSLKMDSSILSVSWTAPDRTPINIQMTIENINLKFSSTWFSRSDTKPYFKLLRCVSEAEDVLIYTSEQIAPKRFNAWEKFTVKANDLCKGDQLSPIKVVVYDRQESSEKLIGEGIFSLEQIFGYQNVVTLADQDRQRCVGTIRVLCQVISEHTFTDYMRDGLKFSTMLAVDYSDSAYKELGLPSNHYAKNDKSFTNDYQKALAELWPFLSKANNTSRIPVYGLGGVKKLSDSDTFDSKEDQIGSTPKNTERAATSQGPWVSSLNDLMLSYEDIVLNGKLGGKCRIASVLEKAKYLAKFNTLYRNQEYTLLAIVTDGHIEDFDLVMKSLKEAENLPMSVIFIGVGDEDMIDLQILEKKLETECNRNCVSFIKFNRLRREKKLLVKDILKEIPVQINEFIEKDKETNGEVTGEFLETEIYSEDTAGNGPETREVFLRRKVPTMMKDWICENSRKEFHRAKEMIDVASATFGFNRILMQQRS